MTEDKRNTIVARVFASPCHLSVMRAHDRSGGWVGPPVGYGLTGAIELERWKGRVMRNVVPLDIIGVLLPNDVVTCLSGIVRLDLYSAPISFGSLSVTLHSQPNPALAGSPFTRQLREVRMTEEWCREFLQTQDGRKQQHKRLMQEGRAGMEFQTKMSGGSAR
jgi:hypothetical protein